MKTGLLDLEHFAYWRLNFKLHSMPARDTSRSRHGGQRTSVISCYISKFFVIFFCH